MTVRILKGDCRDVLRELEPESVHMVCTSPPYYGLRDYGIAPTVWGGDPNCQHSWDAVYVPPPGGKGTQSSGLNGAQTSAKYRERLEEQHQMKGVTTHFCRCSAWRGALGLEPSYQLYVEHMVEVFREVRRVLRKDGTLWLNMGDSYSGYHGNSKCADHEAPSNKPGYVENMRATTVGVGGLKPKDLCGIPWRLAFALQADGWWLRQEIIWAKPNPMPESVTDRCTKSHESIFLLAKSERYFFDAVAIAEEAVGPPGGNTKPNKSFEHDPVKHRTKAGLYLAQAKARKNGGFETRNRRSVWEIPTSPFPDAHFAVYPPALVEPCVLAGCPKGGTVLDPFFGAGTTGLVCDRLGRNCIGIELNPQYAEMAERRLRDDAGFFAQVAAE